MDQPAGLAFSLIDGVWPLGTDCSTYTNKPPFLLNPTTSHKFVVEENSIQIFLWRLNQENDN